MKQNQLNMRRRSLAYHKRKKILDFQNAYKKYIFYKQDIMNNALADFICGTVSGIVQVFIMQPFQIVKVRLANQSMKNPAYKGILDCVSQIKKKQGLLAFYKGTLSPIIGVCPFVSLQFGINEQLKRLFFQLKKSSKEQQEYKQSSLEISEIALCGSLVGVICAFIITPVDRVRIFLQANKDELKGSILTAKKIYNQRGLRSVFLGLNVTIVRQFIAIMIYFSSYEYGMRIGQKEGRKGSIKQAFFVGALAGTASWLFTYPIDYIKTLLQSQLLGQKKYKGIIDCCKIQYRAQGINTFFKGMGVTLVRAFIVNAFAFAVYQYCMRLCKRKDQPL